MWDNGWLKLLISAQSSSDGGFSNGGHGEMCEQKQSNIKVLVMLVECKLLEAKILQSKIL